MEINRKTILVTRHITTKPMNRLDVLGLKIFVFIRTKIFSIGRRRNAIISELLAIQAYDYNQRKNHFWVQGLSPSERPSETRNKDYHSNYSEGGGLHEEK